jgi:hypothetical protein
MAVVSLRPTILPKRRKVTEQLYQVRSPEGRRTTTLSVGVPLGSLPTAFNSAIHRPGETESTCTPWRCDEGAALAEVLNAVEAIPTPV